jgi:hypothetical protein
VCEELTISSSKHNYGYEGLIWSKDKNILLEEVLNPRSEALIATDATCDSDLWSLSLSLPIGSGLKKLLRSATLHDQSENGDMTDDFAHPQSKSKVTPGTFPDQECGHFSSIRQFSSHVGFLSLAQDLSIGRLRSGSLHVRLLGYFASSLHREASYDPSSA